MTYEITLFSEKHRKIMKIHQCKITKFNCDVKNVSQIAQMKHFLTTDIKVVTQLASLMLTSLNNMQ